MDGGEAPLLYNHLYRLRETPTTVTDLIGPDRLRLALALESAGRVCGPVCLPFGNSRASLCVWVFVGPGAQGAGSECTRRERGNVFDIRSAYTAGEAGTAGYD
ncbi:hypothetical protein DPEC_G00308820 [Dallia pectoralis]|uniref:Uncharacterized protein n=1 Tax=Dallia pectoralis TaxID=75939 RepID=A0ACC2FEM1_DALPE|nr:hypothetical protein DPEC_G00308820 [Dallia pectoralis]